MKEIPFGINVKKRGNDEAKNRAEDGRSGAEENSQTDSPKASALSQACYGDSSTQEVRRLKRPELGRKKGMAGRKIELYFSSRRHAGENPDDALERRSPSSPIPITTPHRKDTGFYNAWPFTNGLAPVVLEPNRQYTTPQGSFTEDVGHKWASIDNANSAIRLSGHADGN